MPHENGPGCTNLSQKILQGVGECRDADVCKRLRPAIARHIPGDCTVAIAEVVKLSTPTPRRATDAMEEYQRPTAGIAGCFETEAAISGSCGDCHAISVPGSSNANSLAGS